MILFGLKNCDTCRKALKALKDAGRQPDFHDVRADGVTKAYLTKWAKAAGWEKLLNKSSTTWRQLSDDEKAACASENDAIDLMAAHPTLIKRPVIEDGDRVTVGWSKDTVNRLLS
ncbi:MAG: Spx/MgsR family RNA polymerase-binding regulatory protein [Pseudomonadota bacterium]